MHLHLPIPAEKPDPVPPTVTDIAVEPAGRGSDFAQLSRAVRAAELLRRRPGAYAVRVTLTVGFYAATWVLTAFLGNSWWQAAAAVLLGLACTQVAFLGHDGGHQQIFASRRANDLFGQLLGNVLLGLSFGWWVGKHNRHHANPNTEDHDPDIGEGVLAFTTGQVAARTGGLGRVIAARQAWLFFPLLTFEGINLHVSSVLALRRHAERSRRGGSRASEAALMAAHLVMYVGALLLIMSPWHALLFVGVQKAVWGLYMGCSFAPNHKGMPVIGAHQKLDFLRRQVLTSRNIRGGWFTDLVFGGLNYQIEHHLFPNMPRASLRRAATIVRAHCAGLAIPYHETSVVGSYVAALSYLNELGAPLRGTGRRIAPAPLAADSNL